MLSTPMTTLNDRLQLALLNRKRCKNALEKGFTLVELMIVIVIVGVLSAVALPNFLSQTQKAKATECKTQMSSLLKQVVAEYVSTGDAQQAVGTIVDIDGTPALDRSGAPSTETNPDAISLASNAGFFNYIVTFPAAIGEDAVTMTCQAWGPSGGTNAQDSTNYPASSVDASLESKGMYGCVNLKTGKIDISTKLEPAGTALAASTLATKTAPCGGSGSNTAVTALVS